DENFHRGFLGYAYLGYPRHWGVNLIIPSENHRQLRCTAGELKNRIAKKHARNRAEPIYCRGSAIKLKKAMRQVGGYRLYFTMASRYTNSDFVAHLLIARLHISETAISITQG